MNWHITAEMLRDYKKSSLNMILKTYFHFLKALDKQY